jgi:bacillithiol biosynthesis cysteine-adding enzyme BshC
MQPERIPFAEVPQFSARDKAYILQDPSLRSFYKHPAQIEQFDEVIAIRDTFSTDRELLHRVFRKQYDQLPEQAAVSVQVEALKNSQTYTVITAHQPCLFTGPLYFIYKILSCINLAGQLSARYPDKHIVPVFIIGGEDHDFEEINHLHLFGRRLEWHQEQGGAVGRLSVATLRPVLDELQQLLGDREDALALFEMVERNFTSYPAYGQTMQAFLHELFGERGLLVFNMDDAELKRAFLPMIKREIFEHVSKDLVEETQQQLETLGYIGQAHAREINFFFLQEGSRRRIVEEGAGFRILDSDKYFSREELEMELETHPERFSPNVVMRPLYQELILPNLAYIGGGGEIAYWLERKTQFEAFGLPFPMLIRRNSVLWIDHGSAKKMEKLNLEISDLLPDIDHIIRHFVEREAGEPLDLTNEKAQIQALFERIALHAEEIDPTLIGYIGSEGVKQLKSLEQIEGRLMRAEKQKHETAIKQLRALKQKLFPGNGLQERHDNFLGVYLKNRKDWFDVLQQHLNPLDTDFLVFREDS